MNEKNVWIISGATSIIAEHFAAQAAASGADLLLIGRNNEPMSVIASNIQCRFKVNCTVFVCDFEQCIEKLLDKIQNMPEKCYLFIAHSMQTTNESLTLSRIENLLRVNVTASTQLIHTYWQRRQDEKGIIFISSVAANPGRDKNSLYGASKAAIEVYLEGLQQSASKKDRILIARAGFIDTHQTFDLNSPLPKAPPRAFARRLWRAWHKGQHRIYYPRYWRFIMLVFRMMPWRIYGKMKKL